MPNGMQPDVVVTVRREWERQLGVAAGAADDNFFAAGGNSLQAAELMAALSREFGRRLRLALLLRRSVAAGWWGAGRPCRTAMRRGAGGRRVAGICRVDARPSHRSPRPRWAVPAPGGRRGEADQQAGLQRRAAGLRHAPSLGRLSSGFTSDAPWSPGRRPVIRVCTWCCTPSTSPRSGSTKTCWSGKRLPACCSSERLGKEHPLDRAGSQAMPMCCRWGVTVHRQASMGGWPC